MVRSFSHDATQISNLTASFSFCYFFLFRLLTLIYVLTYAFAKLNQDESYFIYSCIALLAYYDANI